jgi:hypothetical protein
MTKLTNPVCRNSYCNTQLDPTDNFHNHFGYCSMTCRKFNKFCDLLMAHYLRSDESFTDFEELILNTTDTEPKE